MTSPDRVLAYPLFNSANISTHHKELARADSYIYQLNPKHDQEAK